MSVLSKTADGAPGASSAPRVFLFLQGPITPFFAELATELERRGHRALRVNLCLGDRLFWRRPGAVNFRGSRAEWPGYISDLVDREGVTDLVLLGEQRFYHKVAVSVAKARGARVMVTDFGYLRPDWIVLEPDGMSGDSTFPRDPERVMALAADAPEPDVLQRYKDSFFNQAVWDMAYHISTALMPWTHPGYRSHQVHHPALVYIGTGLHLLKTRWSGPRATRLIEEVRASGAPYWVMPLQMENDLSLRAYSPFPDMKTPIHQVIRSFADQAPRDALLLIKVHPLDPGVRDWGRIVRRSAKRWGAAGRVKFLDGGPLATLLEGSRGVVTVNSTVGIWALRAGAPTLTLGSAVYDIEGLTFQGGLDRFWAEGRRPRPELLDAFIKALAHVAHIRGVYYSREGLDAAVAAAADRLEAHG